MRVAATLAMIFAACAVAGAGEEEEKKALEVTREFVKRVKEGKAQEAVGVVHVPSLVERMFGEGAAKMAPEKKAKLAERVGKLLDLALVRPAAETRFGKYEATPGRDAVEVSVQAGSHTLRLLYRNVKGELRIVDFGYEKWLFAEHIGKRYEQLGGRGDPLELFEILLRSMEERAHKTRSKDNIRSLLTLMLVRRTERANGWPRYSGKNFVLSVVAHNLVDPRNPQNLTLFFSPKEMPEELPVARYKEVTKEALKTGTDFSDLTSYAGRRNGEKAHLITPDQEKNGTPLIADLSFPDVAIVGFSNGSVKELSRKELGLGPEDAIVAGDESKSPLLRKLSSW